MTTNIYKNNAIRIMKKLLILTSSIGIGLITLGFILNSVNGQENLQINGMYEDQFLICDFREKCIIIDIDDYMDKETSDNIYRLFNEDLDTFPIQALD